MAEFKFMSESDAEDLIEEYVYLQECYKEQYRREDYVDWSEENEKKARDEYLKCREKLLALLTGEVDAEGHYFERD